MAMPLLLPACIPISPLPSNLQTVHKSLLFVQGQTFHVVLLFALFRFFAIVYTDPLPPPS
jgi:hypothetical protein